MVRHSPVVFLRARMFSGKKKSTNLWIRISSGGVAVFHVKGKGSKSSVCSSKPKKKTKLLGRSFLLTGKSFLLTVGLGCLRSIGLVFFTYGLVFFAYGGN